MTPVLGAAGTTRIEISETGRHARRLTAEQGRALATSGVVGATPSSFDRSRTARRTRS